MLRTQSLDYLQIKGDKEVASRQEHQGERGDRDGQGQVPVPEQRQIQDRVRGLLLMKEEGDEGDNADRHCYDNDPVRPAHIVTHTEGEYQRGETDKTQKRSRHIERRDGRDMVSAAIGGQILHGDDQGQKPHGDIDEKDPTPGEKAGDEAAERGADHYAQGIGQGADPEGPADDIFRQIVGNPRHSRGNHHGAAGPLKRPGGIQQQDRRGKSAQEGSQGKKSVPAEKDLLQTEAIHELAEDQRGPRHDEEVGKHDPGYFVGPDLEIAGQGGQGNVHHITVQAHHEHGEGDTEDHPAGPFFIGPRRHVLAMGDHVSAIVFTYTLRVRGPSNSQKKIPCQVPRTRRPFSTSTASEAPSKDALA